VGNGDGIDDCVGAAVDHGYGITGCSAEADVNAIVVWIYRNSRGLPETAMSVTKCCAWAGIRQADDRRRSKNPMRCNIDDLSEI